MVAGLRPFSLVRSLETVRSIHRPLMGLHCQPTTRKIMEDGRWAGSATGTTPQPCDPTPPAWQTPTRVTPATSSGPAVVSPASMRADHGTQSSDQGEDRTPRLGACWSPTRWLGEGSTVMANAEGQGRRRGRPLRLSAAWRARWHDGCCRPDRSVQHPRACPGEVARGSS